MTPPRTVIHALAACAALFAPLAAVAAEPLLVEGSASSRTLNCEARDVEISGAGHRVTLTGACGRVEVMGINQSVTLESATGLVVNGAENAVRSSGTLGDVLVEGQGHSVTGRLPALQGKAALAEVSGVGSTLDLVLDGRARIVVAGAQHKVLWSAAAGVPDPVGDVSGIENVVERRPQP